MDGFASDVCSSHFAKSEESVERDTNMKLKSVAMVVGVAAVASGAGFLSCSHCQYAKRA